MKLLRVKQGIQYLNYVETEYKSIWFTFHKTGEYLPWQDTIPFATSRYVLIGETL